MRAVWQAHRGADSDEARGEPVSAMSRRKGKVGERMLAADLREAFPELAEQIRRGWQAREGDDDPDVLGVPGFWFESKFIARYNTSALDQAREAAKGRGTPIAVIRANRKQPVAMLDWADLLRLLVAARGGTPL